MNGPVEGFQLAPDAIVKLGTSTAMVQMLAGVGLDVAQEVRTIGEGFAHHPHSSSTKKYGHYYENITTEAGVFFGVGQAKVRANKFTSAAIEFGSVEEHMPPPGRHPLRQGAESQGLRFVSSRDDAL